MAGFSFERAVSLDSKLPSDEASASFPAFFDGDRDGMPEFLFRGTSDGSIDYFVNTGSAGNPNFNGMALDASTLGLELEFASQSAPNIGEPDEGLFPTGDFSTPVFGDVNGDGFLDAVVGQYSSRGATLSPTNAAVYVFINQNATVDGDAFTDLPDFTATPTKLEVFPQQAAYSAPSLVDIDGDGTLDLFVGVAKFDNPTTSEIVLFENDGSGNFTAATPTDNPFNGVAFTARRQVVPTFVRRGDIELNSTSSLYDAAVVVNHGTGGSEIRYYENTGTATEPVLTQVTGTDNPFEPINSAGVSDPTIAFTDLDGDLNGLLDVALAESTGSESVFSALQNSGAEFVDFLSVDSTTNIFTVGANGGGSLQLQLSGESASKITQVKLNFFDTSNAITETFDLFSVLPTEFRPNGFSAGLESLVFESVAIGERFAIELQTIDGQTISFSPSNLQVTETGTGQFQLAFEEGDDSSFDDLIFSIQQTTASAPIGVGSNQGEGLEIIDLSGVGGAQASFTIYREATFNNVVGFYQIDDASGSVGGIAPGQAGYAQAAIENRVSGIDISVRNQSTTQLTSSLTGNALYAPFIIANSDPFTFLTDNPDNIGGTSSTAYFVFTAANPDGVDHIRLLGDNIFGFEDLPGGGDFDYNDIIITASLG